MGASSVRATAAVLPIPGFVERIEQPVIAFDQMLRSTLEQNAQKPEGGLRAAHRKNGSRVRQGRPAASLNQDGSM